MEVLKGLTSSISPILETVLPWMSGSDEFLPKSSLGITPPASRLKNGAGLAPHLWLKERQDTDGAEGLWRIHDGLYDFTKFIDVHPGGSDWLILTKGTDISEAFESHHISQIPQKMIEQYFIRNAKIKRNVPFTFEEDGFYQTLKREVRETIKTIPKEMYTTSDFYSDGLLAALFLTSILAIKFWSFSLGIIAGVLLGLVTTAAHNYIHRKDNFRMYYFQFSLFQVREWRISHVLSHHLYTNTIIDLEISMMEPFVLYLPNKKYFGGYHYVVISPIFWIFTFIGSFVKRLISSPKCNFKNIHIKDSTSLLLPMFMYALGGETITNTLVMWIFILLTGSFEFSLIGLSAAHHHPDVFHDGDTPRAVEKYDWGLSQLDAVMERKEITGSDFLVLTSFGDHCLHHLFPTLDHSVLKHLYPTLEKVMRRFDPNLNLRMISQVEAITGGLQQLMKVEPNPCPPDLQKHAMFPRKEK